MKSTDKLNIKIPKCSYFERNRMLALYTLNQNSHKKHNSRWSYQNTVLCNIYTRRLICFIFTTDANKLRRFPSIRTFSVGWTESGAVFLLQQTWQRQKYLNVNAVQGESAAAVLGMTYNDKRKSACSVPTSHSNRKSTEAKASRWTPIQRSCTGPRSSRSRRIWTRCLRRPENLSDSSIRANSASRELSSPGRRIGFLARTVARSNNFMRNPMKHGQFRKITERLKETSMVGANDLDRNCRAHTILVQIAQKQNLIEKTTPSRTRPSLDNSVAWTIFSKNDIYKFVRETFLPKLLTNAAATLWTRSNIHRVRVAVADSSQALQLKWNITNQGLNETIGSPRCHCEATLPEQVKLTDGFHNPFSLQFTSR